MNKNIKNNYNEADISSIIDDILKRKGWNLGNIKDSKKNIFCEYGVGDRKRADRVFFLDNKPFLVLEIKKPSVNYKLKNALKQAIDYANKIKAPIACATNGSVIKTHHLIDKQPLIYNDSEVDFFIPYKIAHNFQKKHQFSDISREIVISRKNLIHIFKKINNLLKKIGINKGMQRVNEFCNILFLKLFSEQNIKGFNKIYLWDDLKQKPDKSLLSYFKDVIIPKFQKEYSSDVFIKTEIQNCSELRKIINLLDPLKLSNVDRDIKGDAFEYFISAYSGGYGQKTDLGEYFTPRHIVKNIIKIICPKIGETIYDPFCGTGGFLIEAFKHIHQQISPNDAPLLKKLQKDTLFGQEITSTSRLAKMNMILAGDGHNNIMQCDSLKSESKNKYDLVITNIPFGDRQEHLFIEHCIATLKKNGRMVIIIPDGILFNKDNKNSSLRKKLYSNFDIEIISLPSGVFLPYTSVKTSILIARNYQNKDKSESNINISEIRNDGFTLDKSRRKTTGLNDWDFYHLGTLAQNYSIKPNENNNYSFLKPKKNNSILNFNNNYKKVKLSEVVKIQKGNPTPDADNNEAYLNGQIPFFKVSDIAKFHITMNLSTSVTKINPTYNKSLQLFPKGSLLIPTQGEACKLNRRALMDRDAYVASTITVLICNQEKILPSFLFFIFLFVDMGNFVKNEFYPSIDLEMFKNMFIPLPTIEEQEKIIKILIPYYKIIEQSKKIYDNWRPNFAIKNHWKNCFLKDLANIISGVGSSFFSVEANNNQKLPISKIEYIKSGQVRGLDKFDLRVKHYLNEGEKISSNKILQDEDIILNKQGKGTAGRLGFFQYSLFNNPTTINSCGYIIRANKKIIKPRYLLYFMAGIIGFDALHDMAIGSTGQIQILLETIENLEIKYPSLEEQEKIIQLLNEEYELIKNQKKIINIFENKIRKYCQAIGLI
ncbi:MAG: type I restriction enzyme M protein [Candidatus Phytoplasma cynodontis]|nr:MAG: type I restriction enzyme M protein [Candidatus Phytoplasma cynodontis]